MAGRVYFGCKTDKDPVAYWTDGQRVWPLPLRHDLRNHSPAGPNWGYGGSGPAQLALAICSDVFRSDDVALEVYQEFKGRCISKFRGPTFAVTEEEVKVMLADLVVKIEKTPPTPELEDEPDA